MSWSRAGFGKKRLRIYYRERLRRFGGLEEDFRAAGRLRLGLDFASISVLAAIVPRVEPMVRATSTKRLSLPFVILLVRGFGMVSSWKKTLDNLCCY